MTQPPVPSFDHIFIVIMENHGYDEIIGNAEAPYINQLATRYGVAANYVSVAHPSLPNYLALTGGDTFGVTTDCTDCFQQAPNLAVDRIGPSGRTWRAYMESMPSPGYLGDAYPYMTWLPRRPPRRSAGSLPTCFTTCTTEPSPKAIPGCPARSQRFSPLQPGPSSGPCW